MSQPAGFDYRHRKGGAVEITHHGKLASTLRGDRAAAFLDDMAAMDDAGQQAEMARRTGNYKRGNERQARAHPRNRQADR